MNVAEIVAETIAQMPQPAHGAAIAATIVGLGSASAAVFMAYLFLQFIKESSVKLEEFRQVQDQRHREWMTHIEAHLDEISKEKTSIIRENSDVMRQLREMGERMMRLMEAMEKR
ncbi:unnamed protein product [uncultured bacterium]|nr:unnamed protein product [uncultured bacterium]